MYKFLVVCTVLASALSLPTDKVSQSNSTISILSQEKSLVEDTQIGLSTVDKREKREDVPASSSSIDNKRTVVSQPTYQENKPPTFVHPVPVDQIIKNSHTSPQIHSAHKPEEDEMISEDESEASNDDDSTEEQKTNNHQSTHYRKKSNSESD